MKLMSLTMYEFIEEPNKEESDLIFSVYKAVSLKPNLFINFINACYKALNKRVEIAEKRAADDALSRSAA